MLIVGQSPDGLATFFGDANLDGEFNSLDLVMVVQAGEYEDDIALNSTWSTGDWNGDRDFDSGDFVTAFQDGGFEFGPRQRVTSVPESVPAFWGIAALVSATIRFRQNPSHHRCLNRPTK